MDNKNLMPSYDIRKINSHSIKWFEREVFRLIGFWRLSFPLIQKQGRNNKVYLQIALRMAKEFKRPFTEKDVKKKIGNLKKQYRVYKESGSNSWKYFKLIHSILEKLPDLDTSIQQQAVILSEMPNGYEGHESLPIIKEELPSSSECEFSQPEMSTANEIVTIIKEELPSSSECEFSQPEMSTANEIITIIKEELPSSGECELPLPELCTSGEENLLMEMSNCEGENSFLVSLGKELNDSRNIVEGPKHSSPCKKRKRKDVEEEEEASEINIYERILAKRVKYLEEKRKSREEARKIMELKVKMKEEERKAKEVLFKLKMAENKDKERMRREKFEMKNAHGHCEKEMKEAFVMLEKKLLERFDNLEKTLMTKIENTFGKVQKNIANR